MHIFKLTVESYSGEGYLQENLTVDKSGKHSIFIVRCISVDFSVCQQPAIFSKQKFSITKLKTFRMCTPRNFSLQEKIL